MDMCVRSNAKMAWERHTSWFAMTMEIFSKHNGPVITHLPLLVFQINDGYKITHEIGIC